MRWGIKHGLNFVLPASGNYMRSETQLSFCRGMLADTVWEQNGMNYNIFCLHTVWNTKEVLSTLEGPNPVMISIVRDPVDIFESMWHYYNFSNYTGKSLDEFAKDIEKDPNVERFGFDGRFGRNQMLFDFGLSSEEMNKPQRVKEKICEIKKDFDLIMVSERFLDSKIFLVDLLGLTPSEAACLKLNSRNSSSKPKMNVETRKLLSDWLSADFALYQAANSWLDQKLEAMEPHKKENLRRTLKDADDALEKKCEKHQEGSKLNGDFNMWSSTVVGFTPNSSCSVDDDDVRLACMGELQFVDLLRERQMRNVNPDLE